MISDPLAPASEDLMAEFSDPTKQEPEDGAMAGEQAILGRAFDALKKDDKRGFQKALSAAIDIKLMKSDLLKE